MITEHRLASFDGTGLFYRKASAGGTVRGQIFILHGIGEHGGRYLELARYLREAGLECWVPDLRGFGLSAGRRAFCHSITDFQKDFMALYSHSRRCLPDVPVFFLGHSFGGLLAAKFAGLAFAGKPNGLILSSPLFGITVRLPVWQRLLAAAFSALSPEWSQKNHIDPDLLTHDEGKRRSRRVDPLIYDRISARLYTEIIKTLRGRGEIARHVRCASLLLQAGEDCIVDTQKTSDFYLRIESNDKTMEILNGFYHEILNETGRELVFSRISRWISARL